MSSLKSRHGRKGALQVSALPMTTSTPPGDGTGDQVTIAKLSNWGVTRTLRTQSEWSDSDTDGHTARIPGNLDASFTAEGKYSTGGNTNDPANAYDLFQAGDYTNPAILWLDKTVSKLYWDFPRAMCQDFQMTVDLDSAEVIAWSSAFGADGITYQPGASPNSYAVIS